MYLVKGLVNLLCLGLLSQELSLEQGTDPILLEWRYVSGCKRLWCRHEDLSSDPRVQVKTRRGCMVYNPRIRRNRNRRVLYPLALDGEPRKPRVCVKSQ